MNHVTQGEWWEANITVSGSLLLATAIHMRGLKHFISVFFVVTAFCLGAEEIRVYHIGNSLTWDSQPITQTSVLENHGNTVLQGYHIACGQSLTYMESNPDYVCVAPPEPYGKWTNALGNYEWDAVTIQAYPGATGLSEVLATVAMLEVATSSNRNPNCTFFLYLAWPQTSEAATFSEQVLVPFGGDDAPVFLSRGFLNYWYQAVSSHFPDLDIRVVPTGVAYATIDQKLSEIPIAPYGNVYDLYRDVWHMNLSEGRYVATSSMLTALTGIHPEDQLFAQSYLDSLDAEFLELCNEVVWYTYTADSRTKILSAPEITLKPLNSDFLFECVYTGKLFRSHDFKTWEHMTNASSPHRVSNSGSNSFYRTAGE